MEKLIIPIAIIALMSFLGWLTQLLKKAADKRQDDRDRERARERVQREAVRTGASDIDRYLRAVDAQRQRTAPSARPAATAAPVPTVTPTRRPRPSDAPAVAFPEAKAKPPAKAPVSLPDDLPVARVVAEPTTSVTAPAQLAKLAKPMRASAAPEKPRSEPVSPFMKQLQGVLKGPDAAAMAVVLSEVLGPPKGKRG
jgi:hypothetical protein